MALVPQQGDQAPASNAPEHAHPPPDSSLSITKSFRPYYSPPELLHLVRLQASTKGDLSRQEMSESRIETWRQLACGYIERVGGRLGFPRRTIATAQTLYHRFHLHFPLKAFAFQDVSLAVILSASKLEDTLKKLREIQIAGWQILNIIEGGPGTGEGDATVQENHRPHLIAIERLVLQTICFNFHLHRSLATNSELTSRAAVVDVGTTGRDVFGWVIRMSSALGATKAYTFLAHLLAIDVHRTLAPLAYPPHTVALACLYLASFLTPHHKNGLEWRGEEVTKEAKKEGPHFEGAWGRAFESTEEDVDEICLSLLTLFGQLCPPPPPLASNGTSSKPSPSFSPLSFPSPADPSLAPTRTGATAEREKHLVQTGIPHTLSGQATICARTQDDFTQVMVHIRRIQQGRSGENGKVVEEGGDGRNGAKRPRMERWVGAEEAMTKVASGEDAPPAKEVGRDGEEVKRVVSTRYQF
ncbi:hypothetical protein RQP46_000893 [Phenoliferia psychrophenolica]